MSQFRDAVFGVRELADEGDVAGLEAVLLDPDKPRAARLASANALANLGDGGQNALLTALIFGDTLAQFAGLRAFLRVQPSLDESLLLEVTHSQNPRIRRGGRRLLSGLPYPIPDTFRLRCYLPAPHCYAADAPEQLDGWLAARDKDWHRIVGAIGAAQYVPAVPLLIAALDTESSRRYTLVDALRRLGSLATPALVAALPGTNDPKRRGILTALKVIGEAGDAQAMATLAGLKSKNWKRYGTRYVEWYGHARI